MTEKKGIGSSKPSGNEKAGICPDHDSNPTVFNSAVFTPNPTGKSEGHETPDKPIPRQSPRNKLHSKPGQKEAQEKNGSLEHLLRQRGVDA